jgi:hypothetical protein
LLETEKVSGMHASETGRKTEQKPRETLGTDLGLILKKPLITLLLLKKEITKKGDGSNGQNQGHRFATDGDN